MFLSRDIKGNEPVRLLYNVPVCLSANALKQNMFPFGSGIVVCNDVDTGGPSINTGVGCQ